MDSLSLSIAIFYYFFDIWSLSDTIFSLDFTAQLGIEFFPDEHGVARVCQLRIYIDRRVVLPRAGAHFVDLLTKE